MDIEQLIEKAKAEGIERFAVGVAVVKDGNLLIVFRAETEDFLSGYAEIPGGGVEEGESFLDALRREATEETGLRIEEIIRMAGSFDYLSSSGKRTRQFNFLVRPTSYEVALNPREHSRYIWLPLEEISRLVELKMTPDMKRCIKEIAADEGGYSKR